jgi:hypothetical protein
VDLWKSFRERGFLSPLLAAILLVIVVCGIWVGVSNHRPPMQPSDLLQRAVASDSQLAMQGVSAAIHQTVELRTANRSVRREIYRDVQGKRHRRLDKLDEQDRLLRAQLEKGGVNWNDPLSAADFFAWHGHAGRYHDVVATAGNLVTLRTTSSDGDVQQESLTVRATDFHPVMRSVQFRDKGAIEIAELEFEVVPWNATSNDWFEPEGAGNATAPEPWPPQLRVPEHLTDEQIYETELNALLTLRNLHADTERLQVDVAPGGVEVKGIVETEERKRQISSQLRMIAHVTPSILCYSDLEKRPSTATAGSVAALTVTSESSPLERYFDLKGWNREDCTKLSHELLQSSATIYRESRAVEDLLTRFSKRAALTANARATLRTLLLEHLDSLITALGRQEQAIATFTGAPAQAIGATDLTLVQVAQRNLDLSKELLYSTSEESRPAPLILVDLANCSSAIRAHIAELETLPPINAVASSSIDTRQH